jgi:uncharacterized Fe-S center protein
MNGYIKALLFCLIVLTINAYAASQELNANETKTENKPIVYMTKNITPNGLMAVYNALNHKLPGKVAVKISTGEPGGHNFFLQIYLKTWLTK